MTTGEDIISPQSSSSLDAAGATGCVLRVGAFETGNNASSPDKSEDVLELMLIVGEKMGDKTGARVDALGC